MKAMLPHNFDNRKQVAIACKKPFLNEVKNQFSEGKTNPSFHLKNIYPAFH